MATVAEDLTRHRTSFVVDVDLAGLLAGLGCDTGAAEDQEAAFAAEQEALARSATPPTDVPGRGAQLLPVGPGLAAWLASVVLAECADTDLPDITAGFHRLAAWAQGQELATVAEIAARNATRTGRVGQDGQPVQVQADVAAEIALALNLSQPAAMDWTGLASRLRWQLGRTGSALRAGDIDLTRARLIAEMTGSLGEKTAHLVEDRILPAAGEQTSGQLRATLRRAVIAADPDGAERRREQSERRAKVGLYPDPDGTATISGTSLPCVSAAAAFARITAIARAMKAAGHAGGLDYLRAYVMIGLLTGTLPLIPPPSGAPPDSPLPPDSPPPPADPPRGDPPPTARALDLDDPELPPPPEPPDVDDTEPPEPGADTLARTDSDDEAAVDPTGATLAWPPLPAGLPGANSDPSASAAPGRPRPGLLDVLLPWSAVAGSQYAEPAALGRIGPVTAEQARQLLDLATQHSGTQWRVILTDDDGRAQAVERLRRPMPGRTRDGPQTTTPVIGRITVTLPESALGSCTPGCDKLNVSLLRAATRAADRAREARAANQAAGRCAHRHATSAYRPSPRLREFVAARDVTCTFPPCGQPAWRADLDHTIPWHVGGLSCSCNLGGRCRTHHRIKQLPGWKLDQTQDGTFGWTTPSGPSYTAKPHRYPV